MNPEQPDPLQDAADADAAREALDAHREFDEKPPPQDLQQVERADFSQEFLHGIRKKIASPSGVRIMDPGLYQIPGSPERLRVLIGPPGPNGPHEYAVQFDRGDSGVEQHVIRFQNGLPTVVGTNGMTMEVLLAIVADRLATFQSSEFKCNENAEALDAVRTAIHHLHRRTEDRIVRDVQSTYEQ